MSISRQRVSDATEQMEHSKHLRVISFEFEAINGLTVKWLSCKSAILPQDRYTNKNRNEWINKRARGQHCRRDT